MLYNEDWFNRDSEMQEAFNENRTSGLSFALLTQAPHRGEVSMSEKELYTQILKLTHYKSKGLRLLDYEDTDLVVNAQFKQFAECYRPLLKSIEPFSTSVNLTPEPGQPLEPGIVSFRDTLELERDLVLNLNDNVFRNLPNFKISPRTYDPTFKCKSPSL